MFSSIGLVKSLLIKDSDKLDSLISVNPNANLILEEDPQYDNLIYNRANDEFDICCRAKQPEATEPKMPNIPEYHTENFSNGLNQIEISSFLIMFGSFFEVLRSL